MWTFVGRLHPAVLSNTGPEQRVKIGDVLADEVMNLRRNPRSTNRRRFRRVAGTIPSRTHVADRRIEPDVPVIAGAIGNLEPEISRRPRNVPIAEFGRSRNSLEEIRDLRLQVLAALRPIFQETVHLRAARTGGCAVRISGFAPESVLRGLIRSVGCRCAALLAAVAVLIRRVTLRACPFDEPVGEKRLDFRIVKLRHFASRRSARPSAARPRSGRTARGCPRCACCRSCRTRYRSRRSPAHGLPSSRR